MKLSTCISAILVVAFIYLVSYVHSSPAHDFIPNNTREQVLGSPKNGIFDSLWRSPSGISNFFNLQQKSTLENLAAQGIQDFIHHLHNNIISTFFNIYNVFLYKHILAISYVSGSYPEEVSSIRRVSRQLAPRGLDWEESMKVSKQKLCFSQFSFDVLIYNIQLIITALINKILLRFYRLYL